MRFDRNDALRRLAAEPLDVLVVGGGVTGTGVAVDAASRGLRTGLVERHDFASGTSSKSSKLVHGGLRYLQQREYRLVYQALAERQRLRHTAPHLVRLLPFLIPVFGRGGVVSPKLVHALNTALWLYDLTGGARIGRLHERISAEETLAHMPSLRPERVVSGFVYHDAQTDDARLTLALARTATDLGAAVANWTTVTGFERSSDGTITGAVVQPTRPDGSPDEASFPIRAATVVNAAGVWSDEVAALELGHDPATIRPAKGVHITVPWERVRNDIAAVIPVPGDKRSIFVVPQGDRTYIGTTDTDHDGPLDAPTCTAADIRYLLDAMNASLVDPLTEGDVLGTWAGLRPLVGGSVAGTSAKTADLSRRHQVQRSPSGLIAVTGGKLTTYRQMAADAVDVVVEVVGRGGRSRTRRLRLRGADGHAALLEPGAAARLGVDEELLTRLANRYGGDARVVAAMIAADRRLGQPLVETLPHTRAEALYAARYEMVGGLDDLLTRRIPGRWLARDAAAAAAGDAAHLVAAELGWDEERQAAEVAAFRDAVARERTRAGLPATPATATTTATAAAGEG